MRNCLRFGHEALLLLLSTIHEQADNLASLYYEYTTEKLTGIFSVEQYLDCLFGGNLRDIKCVLFGVTITIHLQDITFIFR